MDAIQQKRQSRAGHKRPVYECEWDSDGTHEYNAPRKRIPLSKRTASEIERKKQERKERNKQSAMESRMRKNEKLSSLEDANKLLVSENSVLRELLLSFQVPLSTIENAISSNMSSIQYERQNRDMYHQNNNYLSSSKHESEVFETLCAVENMINDHVRCTLTGCDEVYVSDTLYGITDDHSISEFSEYSDNTDQYCTDTGTNTPFELEFNNSNSIYNSTSSIEDNIHEFYCGQ